MLLVDDATSLFEAVPEVFAQLASHRTNLSPFIVQLLQRTTSFYNIRILLKFLSSFAEQSLHLKILLEVQITQLNIDLHEVIETLLILLIGLPNLLCFSRSNGTDSLPLSL